MISHLLCFRTGCLLSVEGCGRAVAPLLWPRERVYDWPLSQEDVRRPFGHEITNGATPSNSLVFSSDWSCRRKGSYNTDPPWTPEGRGRQNGQVGRAPESLLRS